MLLYVMLKLPVHLSRMAMLGGLPLGGGFVSRAVSYAAGSQIRDAARQHLPSWAGGQTERRSRRARPAPGCATRRRSPVPPPRAAVRARVQRWRAAAEPELAQRTARRVRGQRVLAGLGRRNGRAYTPPPSARARAAGEGLQNGLQTPSFRGEDFASEKFEAEYRARTEPGVGRARKGGAGEPAW